MAESLSLVGVGHGGRVEVYIAVEATGIDLMRVGIEDKVDVEEFVRAFGAVIDSGMDFSSRLCIEHTVEVSRDFECSLSVSLDIEFLSRLLSSEEMEEQFHHILVESILHVSSERFVVCRQ